MRTPPQNDNMDGSFDWPVSMECLALLNHYPEDASPARNRSIRFKLAAVERCLLAIGAIGVLLIGVTDMLDHFS